MILMGFEAGDMAQIRPFLSPDVAETFESAIAARADQGLTVEANFVGLRDLTLDEVIYDRTTRMAEISVRFVAELTSVVKDATGEIVEGSPTDIKRQKDVWTFARTMGADNPNWQLVATGG
jgi:predicted lipid-binding transport protein (Tim44 family)